MPYSQAKDPGWEEVRRRVAEVLEQFAVDFGPRDCAHGEWEQCDEGDCLFTDTHPRPGTMSMLKDWVLVATVENVVGDDPMIEVVQSPGLRGHALTGLLHTALYD